MFRHYCYLYRKLPRNMIGDEHLFGDKDDSDSDEKGGGGKSGKSAKFVDPIRDEFRIYKTKQLRLDEIFAEAKRYPEKNEVLYEYDPDKDGLKFGFEIAMKIHKRVNLFQ